MIRRLAQCRQAPLMAGVHLPASLRQKWAQKKPTTEDLFVAPLVTTNGELGSTR